MSQTEKTETELNLEKENQELKRALLQERLIRFDSQIQLLHEMKFRTQAELNQLTKT